MDKQFVLETCLNEYVRSHEYVCDHLTTMSQIIDYLVDKDLENGVCWFILSRFNLGTYSCTNRENPWIRKYVRVTRQGYPSKNVWQIATHWTKVPENCETKQEILETMEYRIRIIQKELGIIQ